ncbi:MAG: hypothetical protein L7V86_07430 [Verrucomicrobiales bacterium]|nr:hypothetical protein [Verrucomicrobiales bacterium]
MTLFSLVGLVSPVHGDLILSFTGTAGSSTVSWEASGSVTVSSAVPADSSTVGAAPISGAWNTGFDNNLGTVFLSSSYSNLNVGLDGGGIDYTVNSDPSFLNISTIDLTGGTSGGDDFQPDPLGTANYPALSDGDVVSWSGSGSLDLGNNFDTVFNVAPGTTTTLMSAIDGGSYVVNVTAVPEPSSFLFGGGLAMLLICHRRRRVS